ncbi:MAG TPA: PAS domain S-box protein [Candidatus Binatia bacterium]|jgi:PAS domain S-box-containing protein|nr:PAS domain S-box protein [Candidatus Binatia bacterium]
MDAVGPSPHPTASVPSADASSWAHRLVVAAATLAVAGGALTIVGWANDLPRLTDWMNDGISMFPNTALCAVFSGLALLMGPSRAGTRVLAVLVSVIAGLTLIEHATALDLGIDTLLFDRTWGQAAASSPMRMGLPASISFAMTSAALLLMTLSARARAIGSALGLAVAGIAMLSLIGHLYGAQQMFTIPRLTGIALPTASILFGLGLAIVASMPEREPMRTLLETSTAGLLARRAFPLVIGAAVTLGWVRIELQQRGLVDLAFGTALRTLVEILLLTSLLWWAVTTVRAHERARRQADAQLRRQAGQLSAVLETAAVGMQWIGPDGTVLWANDAQLKMLGCTRDAYVGHHVDDFHVDTGALQDIFARLRAGERIVDYPARLRSTDGDVKSVLIDATALWDGDQFVHTQCITRDVTERQKAEEIRALLAAIIEASDDAIVSKTLDGVVTSWNAGAERIFGYSRAEMIGTPIEVLIPLDRRHEERDILDRLRRGERIEHFDTVRLTKDGRPVDVSLTISPVKNASGRIVGASKIARDVTDRKRIETERDENDRRKDEFIAMLAHELRNPLAPIQNATRLLAMLASDEPRLVQARDIIERQVGHLTRLVDDLLDVSRITRGKVTLQRETLRVDAVVTAAVEVARPLMERFHHTLTVSQQAPLRLDGDFARLVQVVSNLLTNAAKFTPANGYVTVTTEEIDGQAVIRVLDTGVGIPREFQSKIFDLFVQADDGLARTNGGLGIGLTLVQRIVAMHGGTVAVRSEGAGRGSEFRVTLPALPADAAPALAPAKAPLAPGGTPIRILIVEDNPDAAESLRMLFELGGHDVRVANDAQRALAIVDDFAPQIAFLDVGLPGMDGYELAMRLRNHRSCARSLLVALTGYGRDDDKRRAIAAGFDHHQTKPVDFEAIDRLLAAVSAADARGQAQ